MWPRNTGISAAGAQPGDSLVFNPASNSFTARRAAVNATLGDTGTLFPFTVQGGAPAGGYNGPALDVSPAVTTIYTPPGSSGSVGALAHACLLTAGPRQGQLMATYRGGPTPTESTGQGVIMAQFSTDQGVTWSAASQIAADGTFDCRSGCARQLADGRIALVFERATVGSINTLFPGSATVSYCPAGADPNVTANWSTPVPLLAAQFTGGYDNPNGPVVEVTAGVLLVAIQGSTTTTNVGAVGCSVGFYKSTDNGNSWAWTQVDNQAAKSIEEANINVLANGSWLLAARNQTNFELWLYTSTDQGVTWSAPTILIYVYAAPRITVGSDGTVYIFTRLSPNKNGLFANAGGYGAIVYSRDNGATWSGPVLIDDRASMGWWDYGVLVEVYAGMFLAVYSQFSTVGVTYGQIVARYVGRAGVIDPTGTVRARGVASTDGDLSVVGGTLRLNSAPTFVMLEDVSSNDWIGVAGGFPNYPRTETEAGTGALAAFQRSIRFPFNNNPSNVAPAMISFPAQAGALAAGGTVDVRFFYTRFIAGDQILVAKWGDAAAAGTSLHWQIVIDSSAKVTFRLRNALGITVTQQSASVVTQNTWNTASLQFDGTTLGGFLNGIATAGALSTILAPDATTPLCVGGSITTAAPAPFVGNVSEVRVSTNQRNTIGSNYAAPTVPFVADANTLLLTHCDRLIVTG